MSSKGGVVSCAGCAVVRELWAPSRLGFSPVRPHPPPCICLPSHAQLHEAWETLKKVDASDAPSQLVQSAYVGTPVPVGGSRARVHRGIAPCKFAAESLSVF